MRLYSGSSSPKRDQWSPKTKQLSLYEVEAPMIYRQSAPEGGKIFSATHRPHLPPGKIPG